jgi:hypothetical protein
MGGACSTHFVGEIRNANKILVQIERKRTLGRPERRCEDNIKMDLKAA